MKGFSSEKDFGFLTSIKIEIECDDGYKIIRVYQGLSVYQYFIKPDRNRVGLTVINYKKISKPTNQKELLGRVLCFYLEVSFFS